MDPSNWAMDSMDHIVHTIRAPSRWSWASTHEALDHHHHERLAGTLLHERQVSAGHVLWLVPEGHWLV